MLKSTLDIAAFVNGILIPGRSLESHLGNFSFNLFVWAHDDTFRVRLLGSATPLQYRGHYFLICTSHQIRNVDPQDVSILTENGEYAVTSSGYSGLRIGKAGMNSDLQDIVVFTFDQACESHPDLRHKFFRFSAAPPEYFGDNVVAAINFGYPFQDQIYELHDKNHIGSRRRSTIFIPGSQPADEALLHLRPTQELVFLPDGLSGGPNFIVHRSAHGFTAYFAGVTVRAGQNDLYFVKSSYIGSLMNAALNLWDGQ